jgi:transcriptional regulator of acetoin/glycerol metabolism
MATIKLYNSEAWMKRQYVTLKKTPAQIAEAAGCSQITAYRKLKEFGLIK